MDEKTPITLQSLIRQLKFWYVLTAFLGLVEVIGLAIYFGRIYSVTIDFSQYYISSLVARSGDWSALYPDPLPGSDRNAGSKLLAIPHPLWREFENSAGVTSHLNYIQPPPAAILYLPLAFLSSVQGEWAWKIAGAVSIWCMAILAGLIVRHLSGSEGPTLPEIFAITLICLIPNRTSTLLTIGNVSPFVGLTMTVGVYLALIDRANGGILCLGISTLLKLSPGLLFLPLAIICGPRKSPYGASPPRHDTGGDLVCYRSRTLGDLPLENPSHPISTMASEQ